MKFFPIVEYLVLSELVEKTEWICNSGDLRTLVKSYPLHEFVNSDDSQDQVSIEELLQDANFDVPGNCSITYNREPSLNKSTLDVEWNRGYHGSLSVEIRLAPVVPPIHDGSIQLLVFVLFNARFSPVRLQFGLRRVENLILWTESLMGIFLESIYSRILNRERRDST
ncbi:MAG: hypothetical protein RTU30_04495 [Candidatus Thorarchaeota archaeon]